MCLCAGCAPAVGGKSLYQRLQDEDPKVRAEAAVDAGDAGDRGALSYLVDRLSDVEPDVRLMAAVALRKIAGDTVFDEMGWHLYDPYALRAKAQERWRQWLAGQVSPPAAATQPATAPAPTAPEPESAETGWRAVAPGRGTAPASAPAASPAISLPARTMPADPLQGSSP
jgi:hypothetical protein